MRVSSRIAMILLTATALPLAAQSAGTVAASCDYARCGLGILPRLTGLDVVRGEGETPVVSLGFLSPRIVWPAFRGSSAAEAHAMKATRLRRVGALLTATGLASVSVGVVRGALAHDRAGSAAFAGAGTALFLMSVPLHFAADAELSRAVWEYNKRFTR